jgi:hypothetical protein
MVGNNFVFHIVLGTYSKVPARAEVKERGIEALFLVRDAMSPNQIEKTFDTIINSGLFHALSYLGRPGFIQKSNRDSQTRRNLLHTLYQESRTRRIWPLLHHTG